VKFLIDAQLPIALARHLRGTGHDAIHVADIALADADDTPNWQRAIREKEIIVSKDEDFAVRRILATSGPQVIWLRLGNCSNRILMMRLMLIWPEVERRLHAGDALVEVQ
jgi:predicted nuclease of predicted toxin-antitoxin system